ncbi:MAG: hypothetical protein G01um101491_363 [Parcubacteria group bacterium Gr01-1014_91]|nr:MAG: hypothetical protein G01um101491_363 [Parcubacteria group bacterium Gr01-1014_91]
MKLTSIFVAFAMLMVVASVGAGFADLFGGLGFAANVAAAKKQQRAEEILASEGTEAVVAYCEKGADKHETFFGTFWTSCGVSATFVPIEHDSKKPSVVVSRVTLGVLSSKRGHEMKNASVSAMVWDHNPVWDLHVAPVLHAIGL